MKQEQQFKMNIVTMVSHKAKSNGIHEIELVTPDAHKNLMLNKVSMINIMSKVILSTLHQMQQMKKSKSIR